MATRSIIDYKKTLTKDEIIKIVEENNIEFIKLEFCAAKTYQFHPSNWKVQ